MKHLIALAVALVTVACTNESATRRTLEGAGFTDIEITGYRSWSCSKNDSTCTGFRAKGPNGRVVEGAVGCGMGCGKGCTIRFD